MHPPDAKIPADDQWYYEIDSRARGPLAWRDLEELLGHSGETATKVHIRKGPDGEWTVFRAASPNPPAARLRNRERENAVQSPISHSRPQFAVGGLLSLLERHRAFAAAAALWVLLNVLFLLFWPIPYARERRYLATLQGIVVEVDQLQARGASDGERGQLALRTREKLAPMIRDLQKSASASEVSRQQLLWCARDLVPKIMGPQSKERDQDERQIREYLESVGKALGSN